MAMKGKLRNHIPTPRASENSNYMLTHAGGGHGASYASSSFSQEGGRSTSATSSIACTNWEVRSCMSIRLAFTAKQ